jgi:hypothetical protein
VMKVMMVCHFVSDSHEVMMLERGLWKNGWSMKPKLTVVSILKCKSLNPLLFGYPLKTKCFYLVIFIDYYSTSGSWNLQNHLELGSLVLESLTSS